MTQHILVSNDDGVFAPGLLSLAMETIIVGLMIFCLIIFISVDAIQKRRKFMDEGKYE